MTFIQTVDEKGQHRAGPEASPHLGTLLQVTQSETSLFWFDKEPVVMLVTGVFDATDRRGLEY